MATEEMMEGFWDHPFTEIIRLQPRPKREVTLPRSGEGMEGIDGH